MLDYRYYDSESVYALHRTPMWAHPQVMMMIIISLIQGIFGGIQMMMMMIISPFGQLGL
jgi:hypothetical protein